MPALADLPGEDRLRALARRFADAERRVRALVEAAPEGNRRALLEEALAILLDLREHALEAEDDLIHAYAVAAAGIALITGQPVPDPIRAQDLGRTLAQRLDKAVGRAEKGTRSAIASVTPETLPDALSEATTGYVKANGDTVRLSTWASLQTETLGRAATSRGTRDAMASGSYIRISAHNTESSICKRIEGNTYPADHPSTRYPPYHPNCKHFAIPVGSSEGKVIAAMRSANRYGR